MLYLNFSAESELTRNMTTEAKLMLLAKQMINIECNKHVYNIEGSQNSNDMLRSFNEYTSKGKTYNISPQYGHLYIYTNSSTQQSFGNKKWLLQQLKLTLDCLSTTCNAYEHRDNFSNLTTQYTMCSTKNLLWNGTTIMTDSHIENDQRNLFRILIADQINNKRNPFKSQRNVKYIYDTCKSYPFVWYIYIYGKYESKPDIGEKIYGLHCDWEHYNYGTPCNESILLASLSSIIIDELNLFNYQQGSLKINFPSIQDYTHYDNQMVVSETIILGINLGLEVDLTYNYIKQKYDDESEFKSMTNYHVDDVKFKMHWNNKDVHYVEWNDNWPVLGTDVNRHLNYGHDVILIEEYPQTSQLHHMPAIKNQKGRYEKYIGKLFVDSCENPSKIRKNYKKTSIEDCNDVCFITGAPLCGEIYALDICVNVHNDEITLKTILRILCSYYGANLLSNHLGSMECAKSKSPIDVKYKDVVLEQIRFEYTICEAYRTKYPRSVVNTLDSVSMHPIKKEIMLAMEEYGVCVENDEYYVINPEQKKIYVGYQLNKIRNGFLIKYNLTNTILFSIMTF